jgi:hypothetical protein
MVLADSVADKNQSRTVVPAAPARPVCAYSYLPSLIHFRVSERFMLSFVPPPASKQTDPIVKGLFKVDPESVFDRCPERVGELLEDHIRNHMPRKISWRLCVRI